MDWKEELYKHLLLANKYLDCSDDVSAIPAIYISQAEQLRQAADKMDQKDSDIRKIREILTMYAQERKNQ